MTIRREHCTVSRFIREVPHSLTDLVCSPLHILQPICDS